MCENMMDCKYTKHEYFLYWVPCPPPPPQKKKKKKNGGVFSTLPFKNVAWFDFIG